MDNSFEIGDLKFKTRKLGAFQQFHILRRLSPVLGNLAPALAKLQGLSEEQLQKDQFELLAPIMDGISKLSESDSEKVLKDLLSAVEMQQSGNWAFLVKNDVLMFMNLDLSVLLQAAGRAFAFNMSGFFSAPRPDSVAAG